MVPCMQGCVDRERVFKCPCQKLSHNIQRIGQKFPTARKNIHTMLNSKQLHSIYILSHHTFVCRNITKTTTSNLYIYVYKLTSHIDPVHQNKPQTKWLINSTASNSFIFTLCYLHFLFQMQDINLYQIV